MKKNVSYYEIYKFNSIKKGGVFYNKPNIDYSHSKKNGSFYEVSDEKCFSDSIKQKNLPSFLFYNPDYYFSSEKEWKLVENNHSNNEFILSDKKIIEIKRVIKDDFNFRFDISVVWTQSVIFKKDFNIKISDIDINYFKNHMESFKYSNNFYIDGQIKNQEDKVFIQRDFLKKNSTFDFCGNILFFHEVYHTEKISLLFKKSTDAKKNKKKKVSIRIPNKSVLDVWSNDSSYSKNDIIYHDDKFYICLQDNVKGKKPSDEKSIFWRCYKEFGFSFIDSDEGRNTIDYFNNSLNPFVEKFLGNEVVLKFLDCDKLPRLNDFFVFEDKNYRIVEIAKNIINGRCFLKVKGIEILDFKKFELTLNKLNKSFGYDILVKQKDDGCNFLSIVYPSNESLEFKKSFSILKGMEWQDENTK